ncbi:putative NBD/HSP70 family sugar kinase [Rubricella aquisinus]|uniref:Putative NBD/HSP70 family sugar kinase n=1 Tax=Rubricella aquisinus TaxID=2028108 RepID=A0A840WGW5_9RHOB|nr:ROK family protein [Rubricella aquisinus]MBB5514368.1 putative NBD/HSP70 family sugar kinase [Rubricella aquisinus]
MTGYGPLIPPDSYEQRPLRQQVLERIRATGQAARIDIAKSLNISPGTVTQITSDLISMGLIEEVQAADTGIVRGRPRVALGMRADAHLVVGIKLSDVLDSAVIVDSTGKTLAEAALPCRPTLHSTEDILARTARTLDAVLSVGGLERGDISAIGLGLPGFIDNVSGFVHWSPIMMDRGVGLRDMAQKHLGVSVHIDNDANLVALAELWFGTERERSDFVVVTIEHGLGMGVVLNHRLYRGARGCGLEFGHTKVQLDGALCRCGQRGCLEAYVADYALVREAATALGWLGDPSLASGQVLEQLFEQAKAGNMAARSIFHRAGRYLALGLANLVNLFDPSLIILSGERMDYDYLYAEEVIADMRRSSIHLETPPPEIRTHRWGDLLWAKGAAALAMSGLSEEIISMASEAAE